MLIRTLWVIAFLLLSINRASAAPFTCPAIKKVSGNNYLLNTTNLAGPQLFFIHNVSNATVLLNHPMNKDPSAKAGWSSEIQPQHWSAILLNQKNFTLSCSKKEASQTLNCSQVVNVCKVNVNLDPALSGNYWFIENQTRNNFWPAVMKRMKE